VILLEILADALIYSTGTFDPQSPAYIARNPGMLPAISPKQPRDEHGKRVFRSFIDGYQALLYDLRIKCAGKSKAGLKQGATLSDLVCVYGHPRATAVSVALFIRHALGGANITERTPLSYFIGETNA